ncbi:unnamed protein product [Mytilus coruscus]|uniref:Uncharacterized protein n=1 Tax=Mytilus coruscus TaxID=42192 RepID=A0A6J8BHD7_MYTCO|nr:unnamed protein product [Mytilus coruscus]
MIGGNFVVDLPVSMPSSYFHEKPLFEVYPWFYSKAGHTSNFTIHSAEIGKERQISLYFPPSFNENTYKTYPNLLVFDLYPGDYSELLAPIVDKLLAETGTTKEFIIIGYGDYQPGHERFFLLTPVPGTFLTCANGTFYNLCDNCLPINYTVDEYQRLMIEKCGKRDNIEGFGDRLFNFFIDKVRPKTQELANDRILIDQPNTGVMGVKKSAILKLTQSTVEAAKIISKIPGFTMNRNVWVNIYPGTSHNFLEWFNRFWTVCQTLLPSGGAPQIPRSYTETRGCVANKASSYLKTNFALLIFGSLCARFLFYNIF